MVTNGGTSEYGTGPIRQLERGTATNSTVTINNENSSKSGVVSGGASCVSARPGHRSTHRLHHRALQSHRLSSFAPETGASTRMAMDGLSLQVTDTVSGFAEHAVARFQLHPDIQAVESSQGWTLALPGGQSVQVLSSMGLPHWKEVTTPLSLANARGPRGGVG